MSTLHTTKARKTYPEWATEIIKAATDKSSGRMQRVKKVLFNFEDEILEHHNVKR